MKTNRRPKTSKMIFFIGFFLILSVSSCGSPHYRDYETHEPPEKFEPIPVERANGIYATVGYLPSSDYADIELENKPAITLKDIEEVQKVFSTYGGESIEIDLIFTEEGSRNLYLLTKANIGKPIALVIENQIIYMPMVMAGVVGGKVSICGGYSEKEIDRMIETLKKEQ